MSKRWPKEGEDDVSMPRLGYWGRERGVGKRGRTVPTEDENGREENLGKNQGMSCWVGKPFGRMHRFSDLRKCCREKKKKKNGWTLANATKK